jgi:MoaA/NifB/PqqE/SkfB family radical SAM enzyme
MGILASPSLETNCDSPLFQAFIRERGEVCFQCTLCTKNVPVVLGSLLKENLEEIWNGPVAARARREITNNTFKYCDKKCRMRRNLSLNREPIAKVPTDILLLTDGSCNLYCSSCRKRREGPTDENILRRTYEALTPYLSNIRLINALGSGEVFASEPTLDWLSSLNANDHPDLRLLLQTNGQLFSKRWNRLYNIASMVECLNLSIDAASKETYEKLRRGAGWDRLKDSIDYIQELRKKRELNCTLRACFVVQEDNFTEMPAFVELCQEWGFDYIEFQQLHIARLSSSKFKRMNVIDEKNTLNAQYKRIRASIGDMPNIIWNGS